RLSRPTSGYQGPPPTSAAPRRLTLAGQRSRPRHQVKRKPPPRPPPPTPARTARPGRPGRPRRRTRPAWRGRSPPPTAPAGSRAPTAAGPAATSARRTGRRRWWPAGRRGCGPPAAGRSTGATAPAARTGRAAELRAGLDGVIRAALKRLQARLAAEADQWLAELTELLAGALPQFLSASQGAGMCADYDAPRLLAHEALGEDAGAVLDV